MHAVPDYSHAGRTGGVGVSEERTVAFTTEGLAAFEVSLADQMIRGGRIPTENLRRLIPAHEARGNRDVVLAARQLNGYALRAALVEYWTRVLGHPPKSLGQP